MRKCSTVGNDNKHEDKKQDGITILQMMRICTMHEDENMNRAVSGVSSRSNSGKDVYFESLSESRTGLCRVNVKGETVPDCGASEGVGPFSKSLSLGSQHTSS